MGNVLENQEEEKREEKEEEEEVGEKKKKKKKKKKRRQTNSDECIAQSPWHRTMALYDQFPPETAVSTVPIRKASSHSLQ